MKFSLKNEKQSGSFTETNGKYLESPQRILNKIYVGKEIIFFFYFFPLKTQNYLPKSRKVENYFGKEKSMTIILAFFKVHTRKLANPRSIKVGLPFPSILPRQAMISWKKDAAVITHGTPILLLSCGVKKENLQIGKTK